MGFFAEYRLGLGLKRHWIQAVVIVAVLSAVGISTARGAMVPPLIGAQHGFTEGGWETSIAAGTNHVLSRFGSKGSIVGPKGPVRVRS